MVTGDPGPGRNQLADLDLPRVWQLTRGAGQRVAVIDTGVSRHRRLPDVVPGGDYVFTGDGTQDCDAHGTLVAGIITAAADSKADSFSGVAPDVTLISIRQSSAKFASASDPSNSGIGDVDTMAKAVRTAADLGASVINISAVACVPVTSELDDRALGAALAYAVDVKNAVVVAAAGNTGGAGQCPPQRPDATWQTVSVAVSPAWYDDYVLTVGSVNADGTPSAFTLAGPWVDVAAIGEAVTSLSSAPAVRHQLRRTDCQRTRRIGACPIPGVDGTAGDAAYRGDSASPTGRMESVGRQRHSRCPCRGEHRCEFSRQRRQTTAGACADRNAAATQTNEFSCAGHRVARRNHVPDRADVRADHRCGQAAATGVPRRRRGRLTRSPCSVPARTATPRASATAPAPLPSADRDRVPRRCRESRIAPRCR